MPRKLPPPPTPESLEGWFVRGNPELELANFQRVLMAELERHARREGKERRLLVMMPPGHAKTTIGVYEFAPWYLKENPSHNLMVLSYDDPRARRFGREIRNRCRASAQAAARGEPGCAGLMPVSDSGAMNYFHTAQGNTVSAMGFNGPLAGERVHCMLIDDPVKSMVEARSEARMEEVYDIYRSVGKARMVPGGIGIIIAYLTRYGMRDFAARVIEEEGKRWRQLVFPAEEPADSGRFLWTKYFGRDAYLEAKQDPEVWWSVWQQQPKQVQNHVFHEAWLRYWDPPGVTVTT